MSGAFVDTLCIRVDAAFCLPILAATLPRLRIDLAVRSDENLSLAVPRSSALIDSSSTVKGDPPNDEIPEAPI